MWLHNNNYVLQNHTNQAADDRGFNVPLIVHHLIVWAGVPPHSALSDTSPVPSEQEIITSLTTNAHATNIFIVISREATAQPCKCTLSPLDTQLVTQATHKSVCSSCEQMYNHVTNAYMYVNCLATYIILYIHIL